MRAIGVDPGQVGGAVSVDEKGRPLSAVWWRPRVRTTGRDLILGRGQWLVTVWRAGSIAYDQHESTVRVEGFAGVLQALQSEFLGGGRFLLGVEGLYVGAGTGGAMVPLMESAGALHVALRGGAIGDTHRPKPQRWRKVWMGKAPRGGEEAKRAAINLVAKLGLEGKVWAQSHVCEAYGIARFAQYAGPSVKSGGEYDEISDVWHVGGEGEA